MLRFASPKEIDSHCPKLAYALSAIAFAIVLAHVSVEHFFASHPFVSAGLGATVPLGIICGAVIDLCGWERLSTVHRSFVLLAVAFGIFVVVQALWSISPLIGRGTTAALCLAAAALWLGGMRRM